MTLRTRTLLPLPILLLTACAGGTALDAVIADGGSDAGSGRDVVDRPDIAGFDAEADATDSDADAADPADAVPPDAGPIDTGDVAEADGADGDATPDGGSDVPTDTNRPPVAIVAEPIVTTVGAVAVLDGSASTDEDGTIVQYVWDIDGRRLVGEIREIVFETVGTFDGTLTLTDDDGATGTKSFAVEVGPRLANVTADLTVAPNPALVGATVSLDGTASSSEGATIVQWTWSLLDPDGTEVAELTGSRTSHSFERTGEHTVQLEVTDDGGATAAAEQIVYVGRRPVAVITVLTTPATVGSPVGLSGADSTDEDDEIVEWRWRLPDGSTPTGPTANFTPGAAGTVAVALDVTDEHGFTGTAITEIAVSPTTLPNVPPVCDAGPDRTLNVGEAAAFSASCTDADGTVTSIRWDWDDGTFSDGASAFHSWSMAGPYTVAMTATDDDGASTVDTLRVTVSAPTRPPVATFSFSPGAPAAGEVVTFDAGGSSDPDGDAIIEYRWDFGDGSPQEFGRTVTHAFPRDGSYSVQLRVMDSTGLTATTSRSVTIDCVPGCLAGRWRLRPLDSELPAEGFCADGTTSVTVNAIDCDIAFVGSTMEMVCGTDRLVGTLSGRDFSIRYVSPLLFDAWCGDYFVDQAISGRFVSNTRWEGYTTLSYNFAFPLDCYGCDFDPYFTTGTKL